MPEIDHLAKLTYLFEIVADKNAPEPLKKEIENYLESNDGLGRVTQALTPLWFEADALFEDLAKRARPIAQASRVYGILAAFAEEMPRGTLKQALVFSRVAQQHYLEETGQGELQGPKRLSKGHNLLSSNVNQTLHNALAVFFEPVELDSFAPDSRSRPVRLSRDGLLLLRRILGRMRVAQTSADGLNETDTVETITELFRDGR